MTKKLTIEFEVDQSLTLAELCNPVHQAINTARYQVDQHLNRIGNGSPFVLLAMIAGLIETYERKHK